MANIIKAGGSGSVEIETIATGTEWSNVRSWTMGKDYKMVICNIGIGQTNGDWSWKCTPSREQVGTYYTSTSGYGCNIEYDSTIFLEVKQGDRIYFNHSPGPYAFTLYGIPA